MTFLSRFSVLEYRVFVVILRMNHFCSSKVLASILNLFTDLFHDEVRGVQGCSSPSSSQNFLLRRLYILTIVITNFVAVIISILNFRFRLQLPRDFELLYSISRERVRKFSTFVNQKASNKGTSRLSEVKSSQSSDATARSHLSVNVSSPMKLSNDSNRRSKAFGNETLVDK